MEPITETIKKIAAKLKLLNQFAEQSNKDIEFFMELNNGFFEDKDLIPVKPKVIIKVLNYDLGAVIKWKTDKFLSRFHNIQYKIDSNKRQSTSKIDIKPSESLYHDTVESYLVGSASINLENLAYMMDNQLELNILNNTGSLGKIKVKI